MKFGLGIVCSLCLTLLTFGFPQDGGPSKHTSPLIGLEVGRKAPTFSSTDQFGHQQSNETLKGSDGTVLLFFRSADW